MLRECFQMLRSCPQGCGKPCARPSAGTTLLGPWQTERHGRGNRSSRTCGPQARGLARLGRGVHPLSHLELHERDAYLTVSGLRAVHPTSEPRLPTADEVRELDEPFGTLALELPLRDAGFALPTWDELTAVVEAAREREAVVWTRRGCGWRGGLVPGASAPAAHPPVPGVAAVSGR